MKRAIEISARAYRRLLKLYPPTHLAEYGEEMARVFRDLCLDGARRRGAAGLVAVWGFILRDLIGSLIREHRAEGRKAMSEFCEALHRKAHRREVRQRRASEPSVAGSLGHSRRFGDEADVAALTEGQLIIGILCTFAVYLQLVILAILAAPARAASSESR
jgi:hypothetical protein